jgi:hypothetical protein
LGKSLSLLMCSFFSSGETKEEAANHLAYDDYSESRWRPEHFQNPKGVRVMQAVTGLSAVALIGIFIYYGVGTNKPNTTNTTIN